MTMLLYFAYGSNMWDAQMERRCPGHRKLGPARLNGFRWIITRRGWASVVPSPSDSVEGVLFEISPSDEAALDGFEGVANGNYHKCQLPVVFQAQSVMALVYVDPVTEEGVPYPEYIPRINAGLHDAQLSAEYVQRFIRPFIPAE